MNSKILDVFLRIQCLESKESWLSIMIRDTWTTELPSGSFKHSYGQWLLSRSLSIAVSRSPVVRQKFGKVPLPAIPWFHLLFFPVFSRCFFRWRFDARRHVEPGSDPLRTHHWPPGKWSPVGWCHRGQHLPWYLDRWWTMIKNSGNPTVGGAPRYKLNGL